MGATSFTTSAKGKTAKEAFRTAVTQAKYDYGNSGYTGSIAEKDSFLEIPTPTGVDLRDAARSLTMKDARFSDTWGPAGCFKISEGEYLFFGWASE